MSRETRLFPFTEFTLNEVNVFAGSLHSEYRPAFGGVSASGKNPDASKEGRRRWTSTDTGFLTDRR